MIWKFVIECYNLNSLGLALYNLEEEAELNMPKSKGTSSLKKLDLEFLCCDALPWQPFIDWFGSNLEDLKLHKTSCIPLRFSLRSS